MHGGAELELVDMLLYTRILPKDFLLLQRIY